jgi:hypothetical protein
VVPITKLEKSARSRRIPSKYLGDSALGASRGDTIRSTRGAKRNPSNREQGVTIDHGCFGTRENVYFIIEKNIYAIFQVIGATGMHGLFFLRAHIFTKFVRLFRLPWNLEDSSQQDKLKKDLNKAVQEIDADICQLQYGRILKKFAKMKLDDASPLEMSSQIAKIDGSIRFGLFGIVDGHLVSVNVGGVPVLVSARESPSLTCNVDENDVVDESLLELNGGEVFQIHESDESSRMRCSSCMSDYAIAFDRQVKFDTRLLALIPQKVLEHPTTDNSNCFLSTKSNPLQIWRSLEQLRTIRQYPDFVSTTHNKEPAGFYFSDSGSDTMSPSVLSLPEELIQILQSRPLLHVNMLGDFFYKLRPRVISLEACISIVPVDFNLNYAVLACVPPSTIGGTFQPESDVMLVQSQISNCADKLFVRNPPNYHTMLKEVLKKVRGSRIQKIAHNICFDYNLGGILAAHVVLKRDS